MKQHILDGAIGDVRFAGSSFSTGLTDRTNWRLRGDQGGGAVMDLGCYCINVIRYMVGAEPQAVWATGKFEPISDVWDTLIGTLDFGDGITGQFDCSFGWTWRECYEVAGTEGTIFAPKAWGNSDGECGFTLIRDGKTETVTVEGVNPYAAELLSVCEAVSTGEPPLLPITDALANMRVIDGLHESAHTGRRVEISGT